MKKIIYLFIFLLFNSLLSTGQSGWDYINYQEGANTNVGAHIDDSDNLYLLNIDNDPYEMVLSKTLQNGTPLWTKNLSSFLAPAILNEFTGRSTGLNGLDGNDQDIYVVGQGVTSSNKGVIVKTSQSSVNNTSLAEVIKGDVCQVRDIRVVGDHIYIVGDFGMINQPTSSIYFDNDPDDPAKTINGTFRSGFLAKFSISSEELLWARVINASNSVKGNNLDVDDLGDVYISGSFLGTATFHLEGGVLYSVNSEGSGQNAFLAKFDGDTGYSIDFNPVIRSYAGGWIQGGDIAVSDENGNIYWGTDDITAHDMNTGNYLSTWSLPTNSSLDNTIRVHSLKANDCGDVYATGVFNPGLLGKPENLSKSVVSCSGDYFAISLDPQTGDELWFSQATQSCESIGTEVLITSEKKEIIIGGYYFDSAIDNLIIDEEYESQTAVGNFIGRYNDNEVDLCCAQEVNLGPNITLCQNDPFPTLSIEGQITDIDYIVWFHNGSIVGGGETYTPSAPGSYVVKVGYGDGCFTQSKVTIKVIDCFSACDFDPNLTLIKKSDCTYKFVASIPADLNVEVQGYQWDFGDGTTSLESSVYHAYAEAGEYLVTLTIYAVDENGNCCIKTVEKVLDIKKGCGDECNLKSIILSQKITDDVYFFSAATTLLSNAVEVIGYEWTLNDEVVSTSESFAIEVAVGDVVCLTVFAVVKATNECCDHTSCKTINQSGRGERDDQNQDEVLVYPNPANDLLNIDLTQFNRGQEKITIRIFDARGTEVLAVQTDELNTEINIKSWNAGMYLCKVEKEGEVIIKKIIKSGGN